MDILCLCPSPCIDVYVKTDKLLPYTESFASGIEKSIGGKGTNVALALSTCGIKPKLHILMPDDPASQSYISEVGKSGIACTCTEYAGYLRENLTVSDRDGETRISAYACEPDAETALEYAKSAAGNKGIVILSGSIQKALIKPIADALESSDSKVIIDSKSIGREQIGKIKPFLIKPNSDEAFSYTGIRADSVENAAIACKKIIDFGAENVIISMGAGGSVMCTDKSEVYHCPCANVKVQSTVGAGDTLVAGIAYYYSLHGRLDGNALSFASALASSACECAGTGGASIKRAYELIDSGECISRCIR